MPWPREQMLALVIHCNSLAKLPHGDFKGAAASRVLLLVKQKQAISSLRTPAWVYREYMYFVYKKYLNCYS